ATSRIWIYDISQTAVPSAPIASPAIGGGGNSGDELDYDPLNQRMYVANTAGNFFITLVDMVGNTGLGQIPLAANLEQPRFNPVDGFVYAVVSGNNSVARIDPAQGAFGAVVLTASPAGCGTPSNSDTFRGLDVDVVTNTGILGCTGANPQLELDMTNLSVLTSFPPVTGVDTLSMNNNLRRWYTATSGGKNAGTGCPRDNSGSSWPLVGVISAGSATSRVASLVGVQCSGRGA